MTSPYWNTDEVALYLRFVDANGVPNLDATRKFLIRHQIPMKRRGRSVLVHRDAVEAVLDPVRRSA